MNTTIKEVAVTRDELRKEITWKQYLDLLFPTKPETDEWIERTNRENK